MRVRLAITLLALAPLAAHAQQSAAPEPIVRTAIDPPRVMVGQATILRIEVLAPNYMTAPPDMPGFQLRNAVTRQLQSININERQNGVDYAGVRFEFAVYPLEPGSFAVSDQHVKIKYAAEPPAARDAVVSLPRIEFQSFIPDAAAGLDPFLTAAGLTIEQTIQRSSEQLRVGDAVTRTVTIKAEGTPAMLLPPTSFAAIDGVAVYPAQPSLQDKTVGRSDTLLGSRVDSATYMVERAGDYVLPAIDLRWWNASTSKIATAHLDAVALQVAANPAIAPTSASDVRSSWNGIVDLVADHWLLGLTVVAALALLGWATPRLARLIAARHRQRHEAWLQSEAFYFGRLRQSARRGDACAAYFALLDWLQRFEPAHHLDSFKTAAHDPALNREVDALRNILFAPGRAAVDWSPQRLLRHVGRARRALRRHAAPHPRAHALPQRINPETRSSHSQWRVPAR